jgi:hypothetical protein
VPSALTDNNPVYELHNVRGRLIALCADGTVWLFDVPNREEGKSKTNEDAIKSTGWIRLPNIPIPPKEAG